MTSSADRAPTRDELLRIELLAMDMAGTTIDEGGLVYQMLESAVRGTGATVDAGDLQAHMGTEKRDAIAALIELGGVRAADDLVDEAFLRFRTELAAAYRQQPPRLLPGVRETVAGLRSRGIKIALTTGFSSDISELVLTSCDWRLGRDLDAVISSDSVAAGRPAPYLIQHAMEQTGVTDVRRVLAAGDTIADLRAARNAGVIAVGVCTGKLDRNTLEAEDHDAILASVADLPELIGG